VLRSLRRHGIGIIPLTLHTGVASLEDTEVPYPEPYEVTQRSAERINAARTRGSRVVATGTTVVRALESALTNGVVTAGAGVADLVVASGDSIHAIDGMITGWHEPGASHLGILEALAGRDLVANTYAEAEENGYLWHEFGDSCLLFAT
jgi:S-adenosylmethionine:tRNA ribosyltransferase-isomerase